MEEVLEDGELMLVPSAIKSIKCIICNKKEKSKAENKNRGPIAGPRIHKIVH
jgi:hypothetical protein